MNLIIDWWILMNVAIAGGVGFYLISNWKTLSMPKKLTSFFLMALVCHQIEEYVFPAGFSIIFNMSNGATANLTGFPLNPLSAMVSNAAAALLFVFVLWKLTDKAWTLMLLAIFTIAELGIHIGLGLTSLDNFGSAGQSILYSPGLFVSLFMFLPIGICCIVYLIKKKELSLKNMKSSLKTVGIAVLSMLIIAGSLIILPQQLLKNEDSAYKFGNRGYYEQFLNE